MGVQGDQLAFVVAAAVHGVGFFLVLGFLGDLLKGSRAALRISVSPVMYVDCTQPARPDSAERSSRRDSTLSMNACASEADGCACASRQERDATAARFASVIVLADPLIMVLPQGRLATRFVGQGRKHG